MSSDMTLIGNLTREPELKFNAVKSGSSESKVQDTQAAAIVQAAFKVGEEPF